MPNTHSTLTSLFTDIANAIRAKKGTSADIVADNFPSEIASIPSGGITPSGSVTLTEERSYDVTDKAQAIVDFSATRADLAEAVTAKGVDTLPTSSFDTIATNIGLISGGGGLPSADFVTDKAYETLGNLTDIIKLQTGYTKFIIMAADSVPTSGYWLYYCVHIKQGTERADIVYRRTGGGTIGLSTTATSIVIPAGWHFTIYSLDDYFN